MSISNTQFLDFMKKSVASGLFTLLSLICFSTVYHFTKPEIEVFVRFMDGNNLDRWAHFNIFNLETFKIVLLFALLTLLMSTIGLVTAIFAKHYHKKASEVLEQVDV